MWVPEVVVVVVVDVLDLHGLDCAAQRGTLSRLAPNKFIADRAAAPASKSVSRPAQQNLACPSRRSVA